MNKNKFNISILPDKFAICQLKRNGGIPEWVDTNNFYSLTNTDDELSLVCSGISIPPDIKSDKNWRVIKLEGPFDFSETGILSSLLKPLAKGEIGIFAISTFNTDYVLIKSSQLDNALKILGQFYTIKK